MKKFNYFLIPILIFFNSLEAFSQRQILTDYNEIQREVIQEVDAMYQSKDFLKQKDKKFSEVHGKMVIDISVVKSGKVSTFFKVDSEIKNIDFINYMSHYILEHKFNFKLPKGTQQKIRYSITF